jgi:UDP-3-O-[3-hydroxymyristoyl] N-acetylglucosamine deacetylase
MRWTMRHRVGVSVVEETISKSRPYDTIRSLAPALLTSSQAMHQRTIRKTVTFEGIGLHSGKPVHMIVAPAPPEAGIVFRVGGETIPAAPESVVDSHYATTIGKNGTRIQTVEHLMAAAAGLAIDNLDVQVDGVELPAGDGSAKPFVSLLVAAGRADQPARRRPIEIPYPIRVGTGNRWIHLAPSKDFQVSYTLDNPHPAIGTQTRTYAASERGFIDDVAPARTYGFLKDVGVMRKNGLARGGSLENAIVVGKHGPINRLRYDDEFVRHKVLDLIGDLALLGRPLLAHVVARNAGHDLNFQLVLAVQRALGLERRPVAVPARSSRAEAPAREVFAPGRGLATT